MNAKDFITLLVLASVWGASYLFMRIATPELGPFMTTELRVSCAALALLAYAAFIRYKPEFFKRWKQYLIIGAINAAIPFVLICSAELHVTASLASILNATTPLFTAFVAWAWVKDPLGVKKVIGLLVGILGVAILVGWSPIPVNATLLYSVAFSLLAALSYAFAGIYSSRTFKGVKPLEVAIGQQIGAGVLLLPLALLNLPDRMPSVPAVLSIAGLALLCTAMAYILYFRLINNVGPVKTLSVTYLVPIFGVLWGVLFLDEKVTLTTFVGLIVIFLSIMLVTNMLPGKTKAKVKGSLSK
jgi:drug/metabolite transporter (DMT)-like permease